MLFILFPLLALVSEWDSLVKFCIMCFPFLGYSAMIFALLSAAEAVSHYSDNFFKLIIFAANSIPWLIAILSAALGAKVKKIWHIIAIILFCGDILLNLFALRLIAGLIDVVLLVLVCITSSASDFWDV